jgi:uncharacterized protein (DUF1015 family)
MREPSILACYNPSLPMARISPFNAWRYAPDRVSVTRVVTQPYDKITPEMQESYYQADPHNLVRIILGKRQTTDSEAENVYTRAADSFRDWRQSGVLRQDAQPSLYSYSQAFKVPGSNTSAERRGFIALARLEDYSANVVFRHELTHSGPKVDRLNLLRATRAHFGQIFMLYDGSPETDALLQSGQSPDIDVTDEYGVAHRVWKISEPSVLSAMQAQMADRKLIIADGHHRYETALNYRNERRAAAPGVVGPPYDELMMTFVNMNSPGLVILPTHRVIHSLPSFSESDFIAGARHHFNVEELDAAVDGPRATSVLAQAGRAGTALLAVTAHHTILMHSRKALGTNLFSGLSIRQQSLDVVQLHRCLIEGVLKISEEAVRNLKNVSYYRDADEALALVHTGKAQVAFLMNPVRIDQMRDIAFAGEVMPQKSTDFYPKLLDGLTIYALD